MNDTPDKVAAAIAALDSQRAVLGDAVVDTALAPLRRELDELRLRQAHAAQQLKQVSVVFVDVVGSTAMGRNLGPEDVHAMMDEALTRFTAVVHRARGQVLKYTGDGILAVFGADQVHEDDVETAVRAGLGIIDEARRLAPHFREAYAVPAFDVRVGVHTGGVLIGGGVDAAHSIQGMTVNIAARMEQAAPAGGMRISHDSYRHVRGVFDVEPQPPLQVKGVDEPIVTYLVQRAKPRAFRVATRGIEGVETRMIGRDVDLARLQGAFQQLYRERTLVSVLVIAEAGIGKSRLLYEFQNWAESRAEPFYLFQGRAQPQTQRQPYGVLRDVLAWRLQIADDDSMDLAKEKFEQGIAPLFAGEGNDNAQAHAHLLGHLIGLDFADSKHIKGIKDDGRQIRSRAFHAAAQMFRRIRAADGAPILLLLDDLHWADQGSLDFLDYLLEVNADLPMLMLGLARPALLELRADWAGRSAVQRIDLRPLDKQASRLLVHELLKKLPEIPEALRELVSGGADGNPFYMEELVKMLIDEGAIETRGEHWRVVADRLLATRVPPTLTGVLQARLDGLKPEEKLALQQASVIGYVFWDQALAAIEARSVEALPGLGRRELVDRRPDTLLDGLREYAFKHQILHHVTYDTILRQLCRQYHAKTAAWLAGLTGVRSKDFLGATAEHFERAGDTARACEYFTRAAEHAAGLFAHEAVAAHVGNALALMEKGNDAALLSLRWRLLDVRERTLDLQGRRTEQRADIEALHQVAEALNDDRLRAEVAWRRSDIALRTGDYPTQEAAGRLAMALAERVGDLHLRLRAQQRVAAALTMRGDAQSGKTLALEGLAAARAAGLRLIEGLFLNVLTIIAGMQDDQMRQLELGQARLAIDRELGNRRGEATTLCNLGNAWLGLGDYVRARCDLEEGLRLTRMVGDRGGEPVPLVCLSDLALRQGDTVHALACAQSALETAFAVQSPESEASALCTLGDVELALGHHDAAMSAYERAHAVAIAIDDAMQHDAAAGLARIALARGDGGRALALVEGLLAHLESGGTLEGTQAPRLIELVCHEVLARAQDPRAPQLLAIAHAAMQARAATITEPGLRHKFLNEIPEHREIVAAWSQR